MNFEAIAYRLSVYCGISRKLASERLHAAKAAQGLRGDDNVIFDLSGGVYVVEDEELILVASLTAGGSEERQ